MSEHVPQVSFEKITPQMAKAYLGENARNRALSVLAVRKYAAIMERGEWDGMNGEGIKFDTDGHLTDGQHRLHAIILADRPVTMMVIRGLRPMAQETIDQGRRRTLSDVLKMRGYRNYSKLAVLSRAIVRSRKYGFEKAFISSGGGGKYVYTNGECLQEIERHEDQMREALRLSDGACRVVHVPIVVFSTICYELLDYDPELAGYFFEQIRTGENLRDGDPVFALRALLLKLATKPNISTNNVWVAAITIKTWNAWVNNKEIRALRYTMLGEHPEAFPHISFPAQSMDAIPDEPDGNRTHTAQGGRG